MVCQQIVVTAAAAAANVAHVVAFPACALARSWVEARRCGLPAAVRVDDVRRVERAVATFVFTCVENGVFFAVGRFEGTGDGAGGV